eukprot:TRINITY_DN22759_c0_g1_i1.p1 TRINITY_DN22759_c0_g1~~TRINITY_DN22759_c0_g1_i1.p1  ORF type:complete len:301 (+),score=90.26 TRINITY_DN22759_c0_g1_i1:52-903(+)
MADVAFKAFSFGGDESVVLPKPTPAAAGQRHRAKVMVVGDGGVGKTSFVTRLRGRPCPSDYFVTMGAQENAVNFNTEENGEWAVSFWDVAGRNGYGGGRDGYYIGAGGVVLVYDVTDPASYESVVAYESRIRTVCGDIPMVLVGNKVDERTESTAPIAVTLPTTAPSVHSHIQLSVKDDGIERLEEAVVALLCHLAHNDALRLESPNKAAPNNATPNKPDAKENGGSLDREAAPPPPVALSWPAEAELDLLSLPALMALAEQTDTYMKALQVRIAAAQGVTGA